MCISKILNILCGFCADFFLVFTNLMMHSFRDTWFSRNQKLSNLRPYCIQISGRANGKLHTVKLKWNSPLVRQDK